MIGFIIRDAVWAARRPPFAWRKEEKIMSKHSVIISTCPDKETAKAIAKVLLEMRLVACVQIFPIESVYLWKGKVCNEGEIMLFIKSKTDLLDKISATIKENHPYEVPEVIQVPIKGGLPEYLSWIDDCTELK